MSQHAWGRHLSPPHSGLNGVPGSIWDFVSGSFSPSPSPILNAGSTSSASASPSCAELARVRRQLEEAKRKIRQWEESWQQVKQVSPGAGLGLRETPAPAGRPPHPPTPPASAASAASWVSGL